MEDVFAIVLFGIFILIVVWCVNGNSNEPSKDEYGNEAWTNYGPDTGFTNHETKPEKDGIYLVRLPLKECRHVNQAQWDSKAQMWRDVSNGFECYFQQVDWKEMPVAVVNRADTHRVVV